MFTLNGNLHVFNKIFLVFLIKRPNSNHLCVMLLISTFICYCNVIGKNGLYHK